MLYRDMTDEQQALFLQAVVNGDMGTAKSRGHGIDWFAEHGDADTREWVARRQGTPEDVLLKLADDESTQVRATLTHNEALPVSVFEKLAHDKNRSVRKAVGMSRKTPQHVLESLVGDMISEVRMVVAHNPNTPAYALETLSKDNEYVREGVAENPSTPAHVLEKLEADYRYDEGIICRIAGNPNTPAETLANIFETVENAGAWGTLTCHQLAGNKNTPVEILDKLAGHKDENIREVVAKNPSTSVEALEKLAQDVFQSVRRGVAERPDVPASVLEKFDRHDPALRNAINVKLNRGETVPEAALSAIDALEASIERGERRNPEQGVKETAHERDGIPQKDEVSQRDEISQEDVAPGKEAVSRNDATPKKGTKQKAPAPRAQSGSPAADEARMRAKAKGVNKPARPKGKGVLK